MEIRNRYHFSNVYRKSVTHFNEIITSAVLTSWISSITSKISWIVGWPWSNHVCVCLCECASMSVCNWFYKLIHGPQKQILVFFVWKFGYWPGEVMEKSWNFFSEIFVGTLNILTRSPSTNILTLSSSTSILIVPQPTCWHCLPQPTYWHSLSLNQYIHTIFSNQHTDTIFNQLSDAIFLNQHTCTNTIFLNQGVVSI